MQEVRIQLHDIREGDLPPKSGFYLVLDVVESVNIIDLRTMYWDKSALAWRTSQNSRTLFQVTNWYGCKWAEQPVLER